MMSHRVEQLHGQGKFEKAEHLIEINFACHKFPFYIENDILTVQDDTLIILLWQLTRFIIFLYRYEIEWNLFSHYSWLICFAHTRCVSLWTLLLPIILEFSDFNSTKREPCRVRRGVHDIHQGLCNLFKEHFERLFENFIIRQSIKWHFMKCNPTA